MSARWDSGPYLIVPTPLPASFYARPTLDVARDLIGMRLVHDSPDGTTAGTIVEVEAYIGEDDPACHAAPGPTPRNQPLYGPPGLAYVYFNYGVHWLVNAVTEAEGWPAAVLIRALAPVDGLPLMRVRRASRRGDTTAAGPGVPPGRAVWAGADADLCRGPGNLTKALGITGAQNRVSLSRRRTAHRASRARVARAARRLESPHRHPRRSGPPLASLRTRAPIGVGATSVATRLRRGSRIRAQGSKDLRARAVSSGVPIAESDGEP